MNKAQSMYIGALIILTIMVLFGGLIWLAYVYMGCTLLIMVTMVVSLLINVYQRLGGADVSMEETLNEILTYIRSFFGGNMGLTEYVTYLYDKAYAYIYKETVQWYHHTINTEELPWYRFSFPDVMIKTLPFSMIIMVLGIWFISFQYLIILFLGMFLSPVILYSYMKYRRWELWGDQS